MGVGLWGFIIGNISSSFAEHARIEKKKRERRVMKDEDVHPQRLRSVLCELDEIHHDLKKVGAHERRLIAKYARELFIDEEV